MSDIQNWKSQLDITIVVGDLGYSMVNHEVDLI